MNFDPIRQSIRLSPEAYWGSRLRKWSDEEATELGLPPAEARLASVPFLVDGYYQFEEPTRVGDLIRIGRIHSAVWYGVSPETKTVMCVGDDRGYVNVDLAAFERSLRVVDAGARFDVDQMTPMDQIEFWEALMQTFQSIDAAALDVDTFWSGVMTDVSMYLSAVPVFRPLDE